jgi:hypothetical protein
LNGAQWANYLTRNQPEACRREIRELLEQSYRTSPATLDAEPLYRFARQWLESPESPKS